MAESDAIGVAVGTLEWLCAIVENPDHVLTREEVATRFCSDARMFINGEVRCVGIDGHLRHFRELQGTLKCLRICFPLGKGITGASECAAYFRVDQVKADGSSRVVHVNALWKIRDGKIWRMVESAAIEVPRSPLWGDGWGASSRPKLI